MKNKQPFSIFKASTPLEGRCLIEANAGTGKTYNITGIATRLIAENRFGAGTNISNILMVTFTRAATKELKYRMTERLHQCLRLFEKGTNPNTDDSFLEQFATQYGDNPNVKSYITNALDSIDELPIFTIHGFCRRLLNRYAVKAGINFNDSALVKQEDLIEEIIADYWRALNSRAESNLLAAAMLTHLQENHKNPSGMAHKFGKYIGDSTLSILSRLDEQEMQKYLETIQSHFTEVCNALTDDILAELKNLYSGRYKLSAREFKETNWPKRLEVLKRLSACIFFFELSCKEIKRLKYLGYEGIKDKFNQHFSYDNLDLSKTAIQWMQLWDQFIADMAWYEGQTVVMDEQAIRELQQYYLIQLEEKEAYSYNELLYLAHKMISDNRAIRNEVRSEYPAALIDEFQDTDPLQWKLFNQLYPLNTNEHSRYLLYLVGDPKQSIYKFRGADIYTYIHAKASVPVENRFTLTANYRSDRDLIQAINRLWNCHESPFFNDDISYHNSSHYHGNRSPLSGRLAPLTWITDACENEPELNANQAKKRSAHIAAQHIAQILYSGDTFGSIQHSDIAVLCSANKEAALMKDVLREYGINSVLINRENVFESDEATELYIILKAVQEPGNHSKLRAALGTDIIGKKELLKKLTTNKQQDTDIQNKWNHTISQFREWQDIWVQAGISDVLHTILADCAGLEHLLAHPDGERRVTNFYHIESLLEEMEKERPYEQQYLIQQFQSRIKNAKESSNTTAEEEELRLESDQNLVRLVTIHRSKGLKYPIVYCPFLWNGINASTLHSKKPFVFHQTGGQQKVIDVDGNRYTNSPYHYFCEELEERLRVIYVAMTRAQHHALFIHVPYKTNYAKGRQKAYSPLDYILLGRKRFLKALKAYFKFLDSEEAFIPYHEIEAAVKNLAASSKGTINHRIWPDSGLPQAQRPEKEQNVRKSDTLTLKNFPNPDQLYRNWKIHSFSSLSSDHNDDKEQHLEAEAAKMDEVIAEEEQAFPKPLTAGKNTLFDFPKGKQTGLCWHAIFEHITFHNPDTWEEVVTHQLDTRGFDSKRWFPVMMRCIEQTMQIPLPPAEELRLGNLRPRDMHREMAFHFQLNQADFQAILQIIRDAHSIHSSPPAGLGGFMNGFIDLTFVHNQRFYIVDYKSNYLGNRIDDYDPKNLAEAIKESHYDVQYHIYMLALCRYLRQKLGSKFDYDQHFGGVYYLYLRGIKDPNHLNGIHYHRPEKQTLLSLDNYFKSTTA